MSKLGAKRLIGRLGRLCRTEVPRKVILVYHAVNDEQFAVKESEFRQQVEWLRENTSPFDLDSLLLPTAESESLQPEVCITFDDGYLSVFEKAYPILEDAGLKATVYVNTGCLGAGDQHPPADGALGHYPGQNFMSWREVRQLHSAGWGIGSHGVTHVDLTRQSPSDIAQQLCESKESIEQTLSGPCRHFAYTWGRHSDLVQREVASAGYATAAATQHGPLVSTSNLLALPRLDIRREYEIRDFIDIVYGSWDFLGRVQSARKWLRRCSQIGSR